MEIPGLDSFATVALWMLPFVMGGRLRLGATLPRRSLLSAAGGISVAYVFVDLLPQLGRMQDSFYTAAPASLAVFPESRVYIAALIGFIAFYVLENMIVVSQPGGDREANERDPVATWVHVIGFAAYGALMGYLVKEEADRPVESLACYSAAMFCHFWVVDHSLRREHDGWYDDYGRWLIAASVLAGWAVGIAGVSSDLVLPTLMGLLAGGVVLNGVKDELPGKGEGRILPFVCGAFGYALLLLLLDGGEGAVGR